MRLVNKPSFNFTADHAKLIHSWLAFRLVPIHEIAKLAV